MEKRRTCVKCEGPLVQPKTGRPRWYCSPACRRAGEFELRRLQARLQQLEDTVTWKRHVHGLTALQKRVRAEEVAEYEASIAACEARLLALLSETTAEGVDR